MDNEKREHFGPADPLYMEAEALGLSVAAIRKAQGKKNPSDCEVGSPAWMNANEEFARDLLWALGEPTRGSFKGGA
ncbi:hypothetical protein [Paraburkholderia phosphatilytica]|uniref:hypothetical protein n=1 Tax=Paraburkholderia phosphatilytica TaxID=2282883 RepID=UPI000E47A08C|nr:hypothetical protein [Paraburkholderia phosphatilytica]